MKNLGRLGSWQVSITDSLSCNGYVCDPVRALRGRAKRWSSRYYWSWVSLQQKITQAGYRLHYTPGVSGYGRGIYLLVQPDETSYNVTERICDHFGIEL